MWFFGKKKNIQDSKDKETEIQAIRKETLDKIDKAFENTKKLNRFLEKDGGVTYMVFLATGGDKRVGKR